MNKKIAGIGKAMIEIGAFGLGWRLIFSGGEAEDILKDNKLIAGAAIIGAGAGIVGIGNMINKEAEIDEALEEMIEI